ncbi:hypothetical protein BDK51DRAFT_42358 [Blyttiomyces helicus]|uniref:Uncharacterized protein n=1 Tax=Blyttiomyces helicus TaxID=388810 RepID=A0A4V1ISN0_9FUNG|nr:hypothetical protein BDK51DRAFT_42358 [Blyttiomyces helicus]|eukprot:RKO94127.1 hypothetical protein BDK51DRAFT_42358 [Blyttiomyces helicus]
MDAPSVEPIPQLCGKGSAATRRCLRVTAAFISLLDHQMRDSPNPTGDCMIQSASTSSRRPPVLSGHKTIEVPVSTTSHYLDHSEEKLSFPTDPTDAARAWDKEGKSKFLESNGLSDCVRRLVLVSVPPQPPPKMADDAKSGRWVGRRVAAGTHDKYSIASGIGASPRRGPDDLSLPAAPSSLSVNERYFESRVALSAVWGLLVMKALNGFWV